MLARERETRTVLGRLNFKRDNQSRRLAPQREPRRLLHLGVQVVAVVLALALWQASGAWLNPIFISTPLSVGAAILHMTGSGQLPDAFGTSFVDLALGLLIACVLGTAVGVLMGRIRILERGLDPLITFGNATPTIAILPLMIVWFGLGLTCRVAFVATLGFWGMTVNTLTGMRAVSKSVSDVGAAFGISGTKQTWKLYLPATLPYLFAGARIALASGAIGMILAEQEVGQTGLGGLIDQFGSYVQTSDLVASIGATTVLALFLFWALRRLRSRLFPWIDAISTQGGAPV